MFKLGQARQRYSHKDKQKHPNHHEHHDHHHDPDDDDHHHQVPENHPNTRIKTGFHVHGCFISEFVGELNEFSSSFLTGLILDFGIHTHLAQLLIDSSNYRSFQIRFD